MCEGFIVSLRTAAVLATGLTILADECRTDIEQHGSAPVGKDGTWLWFVRLPRIIWEQDASWRERFAQAADDLLDDVDSVRLPRPCSRGEEIAFHFALEAAQATVEMMDDPDYQASVIGGLPAHKQDYDWDLCTDLLMRDSDVLFLLDQAANGIEDPEAEINRRLRMGDIRPIAWFELLPSLSSRSDAAD